jgi:hypothetical protein
VIQEAKKMGSQIQQSSDLWDLEHYLTQRRKELIANTIFAVHDLQMSWGDSCTKIDSARKTCADCRKRRWNQSVLSLSFSDTAQPDLHLSEIAWFRQLSLTEMAFLRGNERRIISLEMAFPTKICAVCGEEFELKPDKPGFANRCPTCSAPEPTVPTTQRRMDADERKNLSDVSEARRRAMRELLYRKDS